MGEVVTLHRAIRRDIPLGPLSCPPRLGVQDAPEFCYALRAVTNGWNVEVRSDYSNRVVFRSPNNTLQGTALHLDRHRLDPDSAAYHALMIELREPIEIELLQGRRAFERILLFYNHVQVPWLWTAVENPRV